MQVVASVSGRADDALASAGDTLWSSSPRLLTMWRVDGRLEAIATTPSDEPRPGPLAALGPDIVSWGAIAAPPRPDRPTHSMMELVDAAVADLGGGAGRGYRTTLAVLSPDGGRAALVLAQRRSRATAGRARTPHGPRARTAVVRLDDPLRVEVVEDGQAPISIAWAGEVLVLGLPGVAVWTGGSLAVADPTDSMYPVALSVGPGGLVAAGTAAGRILIVDPVDVRVDRSWIGHERVTALAWHPTGQRLVSGADDGSIRVWEDGAEVDGYDASGAVAALACLPNGEVVAKIGGVEGELLLLG
ncbi:MAG: hypothetical protein AAFZ07_05840 [Actinomycetota bacterium]